MEILCWIQMCVHICMLLSLKLWWQLSFFWQLHMNPVFHLPIFSVCVCLFCIKINFKKRVKKFTCFFSLYFFFSFFLLSYLKEGVSVCLSWRLPFCWRCWWLPRQLGPIQPARRMNWITGTGTTEKEVNHEPPFDLWRCRDTAACKSQNVWSCGC